MKIVDLKKLWNFVDLEKLSNFIVEKFFIWIHFGPQKLLWKNNLPRAKKMHTAKYLFAECQKKTLSKDAFCRVPKKWHSAKCLFAECHNIGTQQNMALPSARKKALGKLRVNCLFEALNEFKIKKWSTTKFHNFLRSTIFI